MKAPSIAKIEGRSDLVAELIWNDCLGVFVFRKLVGTALGQMVDIARIEMMSALPRKGT